MENTATYPAWYFQLSTRVNDSWPNLWYMLASAVHCSVLIFLKSYLASSSKDGYNNCISNAANGNDRSSVTRSNSHVPEEEEEEEEEGHVTTSTYQGTASLGHESRGGVLRRRRRRSDKTLKSLEDPNQLLLLEWSINKCCG